MKGLENINHVAIKLIMKHEDEFNEIIPNKAKLAKIERQIDSLCGFAPVVDAIRKANYAYAIKFVADTYMTDYEIRREAV